MLALAVGALAMTILWGPTNYEEQEEAARRAEDADRTLRGDCCARCAHYSTLSGLCWAKSRHVASESPDWCPRFEEGRGILAGNDLDSIAASLGYSRLPGETDAALRARVGQEFAKVRR